uniref:Uncharacterized protein n=1 Tax=viral metagenome TaxID=1070528 RepID=A0A6M3JTS4_9ZZZZ
MKTIDKKVSHAFGKDIYLLGKFKDGRFFWLEKARWDCGWYWGFGYIETYTNNKNPSTSKDIDSHQHYNYLCFRKSESYNHEKKCFERGKYMYTLFDNPDIESLVVSEREAWELSDLMKSFYTLSEAAEIFNRGNSHLTSNVSVDLKDATIFDHINKDLLPSIFTRIYDILTPDISDPEGKNNAY